MIELTLTVPVPELGDLVMEAIIQIEHSLPGRPYDLSPTIAISQGVLKPTLSTESNYSIAVLAAAVNAAGSVFTADGRRHHNG